MDESVASTTALVVSLMRALHTRTEPQSILNDLSCANYRIMLLPVMYIILCSAIPIGNSRVKQLLYW